MEKEETRMDSKTPSTQRGSLLGKLMRRRYPTGRPVEIDSSAISSVTYHPRLSRLDVTFKRGTTYQYGCVEQETFHALLDSESKGRFFVRNIRNTHPFMREVAAA